MSRFPYFCRATGNSLSAQNDEPEPVIDRGPLTQPAELTEADFLAADLAEDVSKAERRFGVSYRCAVEDQVLNVDALRRAGWI